MNIELHIERLILDGLPVAAADSTSVLTAVRTELTRLLTEDGLAPGLQRGGGIAGIRGADVHLSPTPAPDTVGREIGAAVHEGLRA